MRKRQFIGVVLITTASLLLTSCGKKQKQKDAEAASVATPKVAEPIKPPAPPLPEPVPAVSPRALKAAEALQAVGYRVKVGASYLEYGRMLSDASVPVQTYLDSKDASDNEKLSALVEKIWKYYVAALNAWKYHAHYGNTFWDASYNEYVPLVNTIDTREMSNGERLRVDAVVRRLWAETYPKLTELRAMIDSDSSKP